MKKVLSLLLAAVLLCACSAQEPETATEPEVKGVATEADIAQLDGLYEGRRAYYGEYHDHADTGGTSDGKVDLSSWKFNMTAKQIDFATIVDHKQLLHMNLPEWDDTVFIGGSEAATWLTDLNYEQLHYNMIFATVEEFQAFIQKHNNTFNYDDGHFFKPAYFKYSSGELFEIAKDVRESGGFFTHVHPKGKSYLHSDDPLDYWYGDETGLEVLCGFYGNMSEEENQAAYKVWVELLNMGKRVWATSGSDSHSTSSTVSLTTMYSEKKTAKAYLSHFREGDFTAGPVGIRMAVGETAAGGKGDFAGKRVVVSVGDFHPQEVWAGNTYRIDLINERGVTLSREVKGNEISGDAKVYLALDAEDCMYYRAEVYDVSRDYLVAVGNPIWNGK